MLTIMASSISGLGFLASRNFYNSIVGNNNYNCYYISNAMLSGAVSTAASCTQIEVWQVIIISFVSCQLYCLGSKLFIRFEIDDPQEAFLIFGV